MMAPAVFSYARIDEKSTVQRPSLGLSNVNMGSPF
jgi:hypothetical protein